MTKSYTIIEQYFIGLLGLGALLLSLWVMASRYLNPQLSPDWGEEVIVYLLVWATWISASSLVHNKAHIQTDLLLRKLNETWANRLEKLHAIIGITVTIAIGYAGIHVVLFAIQNGESSESSLHFPLWVYYLAIPLSMTLMSMRYIRSFQALNNLGQATP